MGASGEGAWCRREVQERLHTAWGKAWRKGHLAGEAWGRLYGMEVAGSPCGGGGGSTEKTRQQ